MDNLELLKELPFCGHRFLADHAGPRVLRLRIEELVQKLSIQQRNFANTKYEMVVEKAELQSEISMLREKCFRKQSQLLDCERENADLIWAASYQRRKIYSQT